ncbi:hypothetical protein TTHERM_000037679 (macronuclear) [Tetrahymena thermophila SB210]|uniref:Uncharacterized protein n=1 Tax=Tetrahymena thermophila (strain SB210) TaxID=312017 RepID=W7XEA7_TETTS|nr:hypothetical protein TTHERM_000037679 [Tetrahymena thermophila SB210]EWS74903.1 hypothetical protein TTHERM_000037679 [Tetrahymena thermophila SB210]|eukprot:XP_012652616.1 hypothetical protein TTHERM_000037679 [Tetrahymena thermophila SB210]
MAKLIIKIENQPMMICLKFLLLALDFQVYIAKQKFFITFHFIINQTANGMTRDYLKIFTPYPISHILRAKLQQMEIFYWKNKSSLLLYQFNYLKIIQLGDKQMMLIFRMLFHKQNSKKRQNKIIQLKNLIKALLKLKQLKTHQKSQFFQGDMQKLKISIFTL